MIKRREIHQQVLEAKNSEELVEAYNRWAENYDHDLISEMGYQAPKLAVRELLRYHSDKKMPILDAGCGTGLIGDLLGKESFQCIDGLDFSKGMLEQAEKKGVYRNLIHGDMNKTLDIADNAYAAAICVGTFTSSHVGPSAFSELIRITRPGGIIIATVRLTYWKEEGFRSVLRELENSERWILEELKTLPYVGEDESQCKLVVFTVC